MRLLLISFLPILLTSAVIWLHSWAEEPWELSPVSHKAHRLMSLNAPINLLRETVAVWLGGRERSFLLFFP